MDDSFPIIDPHHHLWDLENHRYPWLQDGVKPIVFGDYTALCKSYLLEDFLADARRQNVVKSVHLDVGYDPTDPVGETRWLQALADRHGYPHGIVGYADLSRPDVEDLLAAHCEAPNFRGIRQSLNYDPDPVKTYLNHPGVSMKPTGAAASRNCAASACRSICRSTGRRWPSASNSRVRSPTSKSSSTTPACRWITRPPASKAGAKACSC